MYTIQSCKIGVDGVVKELREKSISESALERIMPLFEISGTTTERLDQMRTYLASSEIGLKGIEELEFINNAISKLGLKTATLQLDVTLARGLNYYTGAIFEVGCEGFKGSICGGGRYDGLTDLFGLKGINDLKPNLVFLDIQMPDGTGFDLLEIINKECY